MIDKHTPEPWTQDERYIVAELPKGRPGGEVIISAQPTTVRREDYPDVERIANAARVVACVNALQGQDPARVKAKLDAIDKALPILKAHRDSIRDNPTMRDMSKASHVSFCAACQAYMILSEARALEGKP